MISPAIEPQTKPALLGDLLSAAASRFPDREAIVAGDMSVTWRQYDQAVTRLAKAFIELGVEAGDRIGIYLPNRPEYLFAFLAAARIGAIVVGYNVVYTPREVHELAKKTRPKVFIMAAGESNQELCDYLQYRKIDVDHVLIVDGEVPNGSLSLKAVMNVQEPLMGHEIRQRASSIDPDDGVLIVPTGGSSGRLMGALLSHKNIIANIQEQISHLNFRYSDRLLLHLPLSHVSGATILAVASLMTGATVVLIERFHPVLTLETVVMEGITILGQVPTMFIMEMALPHFEKYDLSSLRMVIVAGAPTPKAIMTRLTEMASRVVHGYGLTEVGGFVTFSEQGDSLEMLCQTVGRPMPSVEIRIVNEERLPVPPGDTGEIALHGPMVMRGYYGDDEESQAVIDDQGWFYTGDLGHLDNSGYLALGGLKKEMFLSGGYNVYPREIEEYIGTHPGVALAICVGIDHEVLGQVGALYVVPMPGNSLTAPVLKGFCKKGLAPYKIPRLIRIGHDLPVTAAGKVDKVGLAARISQS